MSTREGWTDWISRSAAAVREDARRALHELVSRGDLSSEEAGALEQAIEDALGRSATFVSENVLAPLGALLGEIVSPSDAELRERLEALDRRLERIERHLRERDAAPDAPPRAGVDEPPCR